jgi:ABC-2 type transport system ATP-binding protein
MCYLLDMDDTRRSQPVIQVTGLFRTFVSRKASVEAVAGIDLEVEQGAIFGFLGPNGAGKTTTLRMLATLLPPTGGNAMVAGFDLRREPARVRERIGYVSQAGGTDHSITGRGELVFQARLYRLSARDADRRAAELIRAFELESCADRKIETYSGGQRRRLDVALGLVHRPHLLFLDEPTTGLDPQSRARMWDEVRGLRATGTTVFLTTHYLEEADALCDRIAIIDHGRIVAQGTPDELKRAVAGDVVTIGIRGDRQAALNLLMARSFVRDHDPLVPDTNSIRLYVEQGETAMPAIFRILDQGGVTLERISLSRPSLDDVFLRQTGRSLREDAA